MESELFSKLTLESQSKPAPNPAKRDFNFATIEQDLQSEKKSVPSASFSVLSYNILADAYASSFERRVPQEYLDFSYRGSSIIDEIIALSSDIVCLQEVDNFKEFYKGKLEELNYAPVFVKRPLKDKPDGLVLAVKKDVFQVESCGVMEFGNLSEYKGKNAFKKGNIAIVARLKHKASGELITIINTHFYWDPKLEHVKYSQMCEILTYVNMIRKERKDPIIVVGDFNSEPKSNLMQYLLKGSEPTLDALEGVNAAVLGPIQKLYTNIKRTCEKLPWASAYELYGAATSDYSQSFPRYTNYKSHFRATLDHILYLGSNLVPKALLMIPTPKEIGGSDIPNKNFPSDHLPIMARFDILKTTQ